MELPTEPVGFLVTGLGLGVAVYAALGVLFAVPFVLRGAGRLDPLARTGTWGFRLAILPGAIAFWLPLAIRWARAEHEPPAPRTAHTLRARPSEEHA